MASKDKCTKCVRVVKDGVQCALCECCFHAKCIGLSDDCAQSLFTNRNVKWFCDVCLKFLDNFKNLSGAINDSHNKLLTEIRKIADGNETTRNEINNIKQSLKDTEDKLLLSGADVKLGDEFATLKKELNLSWSDIVKKEIGQSVDSMCNEVKLVKKSLEEKDEAKDRENNLIMFKLAETVSHAEDKKIVMKILKHVSSDVIKEKDIVRITRVGKKSEGVSRPVLVVFDALETKLVVFKNLVRMKTLDNDLNKVAIRHDMSSEQRAEHNKWFTEAKKREENDQDRFLYRVRGTVGRWRIIRFQKKLD